MTRFSVLRSPQMLLLTMTFVMAFCFSTWQVLLNNFVIERAQFSGAEIGMLQSLREIPGFLAFTAVFILVFVREQRFALASIVVLALGVGLTGIFPSVLGLYLTTVLMSTGFHYFETINKSLTLQWLKKDETAQFLGQALSVKAMASLGAYALIWLAMGQLGIDYLWMYLLAGGLGVVVTIVVYFSFPDFGHAVPQNKHLVFRKRYWLYYALVFLSGARRQIFMVFAGFMMVEKFGYSVANISALFIVNYSFNLFFAKAIGRWVGRLGERRALCIEYVGLIVIFMSYAVVERAEFAAVLYVLDHMFFAFAIAITTYFQKIADDRDIASTASVSFTINHIAAVFIPALLGLVWLYSNALVFMVGAGLASCSLILSLLIPHKPEPGNEWIWTQKKTPELNVD